MKTNVTIKHLLLAFTFVLSMAACKKDKKDPEPTPPAEVKSMTFTELKALSTGASVKVPDAKKIKGIVISDVGSKNIDSKTVILQEAADKPGIIVTFDAAQTFAMNDEVEVNISNQTLAQVDGEITLQNVPAANAKKTGAGTIAAKATTIADLKTNKVALNGTLVTIAATELTGTTGKYAGNLTITDASGTITSTVLTGAFTGTDLPPSVSAITGIVRISGADARVDIRKTSDVVIGAVARVVTEDFLNVTSIDPSGYLGAAGFTTPFGEWSEKLTGGFYNGQFLYALGSTYDPEFTTPGRKYLYCRNGAAENGFFNASFVLHCSFTDLKGLKTISVTFAGSKTTELPAFSGAVFPGNPLNPATDYLQIGILPGIGDKANVDDLMALSPKYKKTGEFNTFTWTLPTKEQLITTLKASGLTAADAEQTSNAWLENPVFDVRNYSSARPGPNASIIATILYDKVVFGYGN